MTPIQTHWRFCTRVVFFACLLVFVSGSGFGQDIEVIFSEDFESTEPLTLPEGWTEENWSDPDDNSNLAKSDELMGWVVLTEEQLGEIDSNRLNVPAVLDGKSLYAESDKRSGLQFQYVYTPVLDLSAYAGQNIVIEFDSNYTQNQDNINFAEYTLEGDQPNDQATWYPIFYWVDSPEVDIAKESAAADPNATAVDYLFETNFVNDDNVNSYDFCMRAERSLIDIDKHIQGLINDDQVSSKKRVFFALPEAAGQSKVKICFAQCGGASWYWGIDNLVIGAVGNLPPETPTLTSDKESYFPGDLAVLTGSDYSDPDGDAHASSNWILSLNEDLSDPVFESLNDTENLTSMTIPADTLVPGNSYYAKVEYVDSTGSVAGSDPITLVVIDPTPELPEGAFFYEDFDSTNKAGLLYVGWDIGNSDWASEVGTEFGVAPDYPAGRAPNSSTGSVYPPTVDGTPSSGGYLISDSDAASGSDDIFSEVQFYAITPSFSTEGSTEVWLHADAEMETNNNGECIFELAVSVDGGETWTNQWVCVEPQRPMKGGDGYRVDGLPEIGGGSLTKTWDGIHGRWHVELPAAVDQPDVKIRIQFWEPADAWWIALDNILVDSTPPPSGEETVLTEDFTDGIPDTWRNTPSDWQTWTTEPLKDENGDYYRNVDLILADADTGLFDGRGMNMLCGQGYAMWQEGDDDTQSADLDTPVLDLSGYGEVYLAFDSEVLVGNGSSVYEVYVSVDGGQTFNTRLFTYTEALMNYEEGAYFMRHYLPVPEAAGKDQVVFRFHAAGGDPGEMEGFWVVDNVEVTASVGAAPVEPTPTPTPSPVLFSAGFDEATVEEAGIAYDAATGFSVGRISIGNVPTGDGTDGRGLILDTGPGEGTLAIMGSPVSVGTGVVLISVSVQSNGPGCSVALAALNSPIDGQLGYTVSSNVDVPVGEWRQLLLAYDPPSDALQPGVQVSVNSDQPGVSVSFDNLTVMELPALDLESVTLDADGAFETTDGILTNVNNDDGTVDFGSQAGEAVLSLTSGNTAANVGIFAGSLQGGFPHLLQAAVDARLVSGSGGVTALVMTNGNGNVGVFVNNSTLPSTITIGGGFESENSAFPILGVVQNGGPGVTSSVAVDNLSIYRVTSGL